ncbi:MAG: (deoxy)nucleoside triphosphate pyrophosphohydrolase [Candidatus Methylomirabilia bacterium]
MGPPLEVVAAVIEANGRYLITRRERGHLEGLWEFPGGKIRPGEPLVECLRRELLEELAVEVTVGEKLETITWAYPERTVVLHFFRCGLAAGQVTPQEGQAMAWVTPLELWRYPFPPADATLIARLASHGLSRSPGRKGPTQKRS